MNRLITTVLVAIISTLTLAHAASTAQEFGLIGPQSVMLFLNGFHFISGHSDWALQANHHCAIMNSDFIQCAIYASNTHPARLAGIEYIVSGTAFANFSYEERQLWHSHQYEVKSGLLTEPGTPDTVDDAVMEILVNSYGKTVHTWRYDQRNSSFPFGIPEFVNGYTGDGQVPEDLVNERDSLYDVNTTLIKDRREGIVAPDVIDGADCWKKGIVLEYGLVNKTENTTF